MNVSRTWGTTAAERALAYPCDDALADADVHLWRGVSAAAPVSVVYAWLCQLRVAPYSYDWIDNWARRSPRMRNPALEELEPGQVVMTVFRLTSFERDRHLTASTVPGTTAERLFGAVAVSYLTIEEAPDRCRLLAKVVARSPRGLSGRLVRWLLPWGDLLMMRRQLKTLARLAQREAAGRPGR